MYVRFSDYDFSLKAEKYCSIYIDVFSGVEFFMSTIRT